LTLKVKEGLKIERRMCGAKQSGKINLKERNLVEERHSGRWAPQR